MKTPFARRLQCSMYVLNLTRFSVFVLIAVTILLWADQGQDLLISAHEEGYGRLLRLLCGVLLWACSIWLWARVLLDIRFPHAPFGGPELGWYRRHLPRVLAALAFVSVAVNLYRAMGAGLYFFVTVAVGTLFWLALWKRRAIGRWLAYRMRPEDPGSYWSWADELGDYHPEFHAHLWAAIGEIRGRIAAAILITGIMIFVIGLVDPLYLGKLHALFLLMIWSATLLPIGSVMTYWGNKTGLPVLTLILLLAAISSWTNDNHAIRTLPTGYRPADRPTIVKALQQWERMNCPEDGTNPAGHETICHPFLLVAAAGGGIRAAYWTATVLGQLHDLRLAKPFDQLLFAISGVSGGSVGAAVYRAAALEQPDKALTPLVQAALRMDFLGPLTAGLLYPDFLQRFLPIPLLQDRARVFEQAIEDGFDHGVRPKSAKRLAASFIALALQENPWPALFFNSTWSENGRRLVMATLQPGMDASHVLYQDFLDVLGEDIPISTAAHNSARFPYVSPPGRWTMKISAPPGVIKPMTADEQRLQDGGLFENYGAETAIEILQIAYKVIGQRLNPRVILISSDPQRCQMRNEQDRHAVCPRLAQPSRSRAIRFAYELRSTLHTYLMTRLGRGAEAASRLETWTKDFDSQGCKASDCKRFVHFQMCDRTDDPIAPPLGWALAMKSAQRIERYLASPANGGCPGNGAALDTVKRWLAN